MEMSLEPNLDPLRVDAVSFERLERDPNAPLAVALMVASNDLYFDFNGLQCYLDHLPDDGHKLWLQQAAAIYHSRLICSRMLECLDLIHKIEHNGYFMSLLAKDPSAIEAFYRLLEYKKGGKYADVQQRLERIRNNGSFHYESLEKLFRQLFRDDFKPYAGKYGLVVMFPENSPFFQRYFMADTLLSAVMVSRLFPAPEERPRDSEELYRDYDNLPKTIRDFAVDFYRVVMTVLNQYIFELQEPEP